MLRLGSLAREAARVLRTDRVAYWEAEQPGSELRCVVRFHRRESVLATPASTAPELAAGIRRFLDEGGPHAVDDATRDRPELVPLRPWIAAEGIRACLFQPLSQGEIPGALVTFEEDRGPRRWTPHARDLAAALARRFEVPGDPGAGERDGSGEATDGTEAAALPGTAAVAPPPQAGQPVTTVTDPGAPSGSSTNGRDRVDSEPDPKRDPIPARPPDPSPDPLADPSVGSRSEPEPEEAPVGGSPAGGPSAAPPRRASGPTIEDDGSGPHLSRAEAAALLAAEEVPGLLETLDLQRGYFRLLESELEDRPDDRSLIAGARAAGRRVEEGLETFLRRLERGIAAPVPMELGRLLSAMIASLAHEAGNRVRLRVAPSAESIPVAVDAPLLERAFVHLVRNVRETAPPGADLRLSWGRVYARAGAPSSGMTEVGLARIRFEDRAEVPAGTPPPSGLLDRPAAPPRAAGDGRGTGSGPAATWSGPRLVRAVVDAHGGWVDSGSTASGAVLDLYLPLAHPPTGAAPEREAAGAAEGPSRHAEASEAAPEPTTPAILLLEDDPLLAEFLERVLIRAGHEVLRAATAAEAERVWQREGGRIELVLAERRLAGGTCGVDLALGWRSVNPDLPVLALERRTRPGAGEGPGSVPSVSGLTRPFDPDRILKRVRGLLGRVPTRGPDRSPATDEVSRPSPDAAASEDPGPESGEGPGSSGSSGASGTPVAH